jgi:hypothetical protein
VGVNEIFKTHEGLSMTSSNDVQPFALLMMQGAKFKMGQLVATPGSLEVLLDINVLPIQLIRRHMSGDWGAIHPEDRDLNELALIDGGRLMSVYKLKTAQASKEDDDVTIWVITEADRSVTTILLPSEY